MKVFVIFWPNSDNYHGIVVGDSDMTTEGAKLAYLQQYKLDPDSLFAFEESSVVDDRSYDLIDID